MSLNSREDTLYADYTDLYLDMKEDTLNWLTLDSVNVARLEYLSRTSSPVQSYAMSARALRGDTTYHRSPELAISLEERLANTHGEIKKPVLLESLRVFPNPNAGQITLEINAEGTGTFTYKIFDLTGRSLIGSNFSKSKGYSIINISLSDLSDGLYFIEVNDSNNKRMGLERIIVSR